jgi:hypothetical protein
MADSEERKETDGQKDLMGRTSSRCDQGQG